MEEKKNNVPTKEPKEWPYFQLFLLFVVSFILQDVALSCLCYRGEIKMSIALGVDLIFVIRVLLARIRREKNKEWIFYAIFILSSFLWITLLSMLLFGH